MKYNKARGKKTKLQQKKKRTNNIYFGLNLVIRKQKRLNVFFYLEKKSQSKKRNHN